MSKSTPDMSTLKVQVRSGQDWYWKVMLQLDIAGAWSVRDITGYTKVKPDSVREYLKRLLNAGVVEEQGEERKGNKLYRLTRRPMDAPRVRRDGTTVEYGVVNEQMWSSICYLPQFSSRELALQSSTDVVKVALETAKTYCRMLERAGYLAVIDVGGPGRERVYALKPDHNFGGRAPMILRTKFVFDPNINQIVGPGEDAREVLP